MCLKVYKKDCEKLICTSKSMCGGCDLLKPVRLCPEVSLYRCKIKAIDKHFVVPERMNRKDRKN